MYLLLIARLAIHRQAIQNQTKALKKTEYYGQ